MKKKPILLIAEESEYSSRIHQLLDGYEIYQCATLDEGVRLCRVHEINLVLISEQIRGGSGCELFNRLRAQCPAVSGMLLAGTEDNLLLRRAIEAGVCGLVKLPLEEQQLKEQVHRVMESLILREENTRLHTLLPLYSLGERFLATSSEKEVLDILLDEVVKLTGAGHVSVMLYDSAESILRIAAARGMDRDLAQSIRIKPGDQIAGWVFARGEPVILNRDTQEKSPFASLLKRSEIISAISFPMMVRDNIIGVLNISRTREDILFSESDIETLGIICGQAALAVENVRSLELTRKTTRIRTLLEQYVAPEVAELLLAEETDVMGLGEIKDVTVLFADIRNFTSLVQHLELAELRRFLNQFFQIFTDTIFQHRGTVDKFMGDAVLAVFGAPVELDNASLAAVRTARVIRDRFEQLRLQWADRCDEFQQVDLGIAVTSGRMYLGNVGSTRRLDYTVIGTPVNIAQRLAAESSRCRIYMTEAVARAIREDEETLEVGNVSLRGVDQDVRIFSVD